MVDNHCEPQDTELKNSAGTGDSTTTVTVHLTPREMAGLFYALREGASESTLKAKDHVESCSTCYPEWELIQASESKLGTDRMRSVGIIIKRVLAREDEASAVEPRHDESMSSEEAERYVRGFESDLTDSPHGTAFDGLIFEIITSQSLSMNRILEICESIQEMNDQAQRIDAAILLAEAFRERVDKYEETIGESLSELISAHGDLDLLRLELDPVLAGCFAASIPATLYFDNPRLLERQRESVLFRRSILSDRCAEFLTIQNEHPAITNMNGPNLSGMERHSDSKRD